MSGKLLNVIIEEMNDYTLVELPTSRDGLNIYGLAYIPKGDKSAYPTAIISHGFNGSYSNYAEYGQALAKEGIASYVFDFCGGSNDSKSDGAMSDMSVLTEVADLNAVIDFVRTLDFVDDHNVYLLGESQGGLVSALTAAARADEIKGMVLYAPAFLIPDDAANMGRNHPILAIVGTAFIEDALSIDLYKDVQGYTKNVLILHGDADSMVPVSYAKAAAEAYASAELIVVEGGDHHFNQKQNPLAITETLKFIKVNSPDIFQEAAESTGESKSTVVL